MAAEHAIQKPFLSLGAASKRLDEVSWEEVFREILFRDSGGIYVERCSHKMICRRNSRNQPGVHCRQGLGRSALLAACVLVVGGVDVPTAIDRLTKARGCAVPETAEQREWIERRVSSVQPGG